MENRWIQIIQIDQVLLNIRNIWARYHLWTKIITKRCHHQRSSLPIIKVLAIYHLRNCLRVKRMIFGLVTKRNSKWHSKLRKVMILLKCLMTKNSMVKILLNTGQVLNMLLIISTNSICLERNKSYWIMKI